MAKSSIDIVISTILKKTGIDAARAALSNLATKTKDFAKAAGSNLTNIKSGFEMFASAATKALQLVSKAFKFETMAVQFKTLLGNLSDAKAHLKDLQDLGDTPPFSLEQFAAASRTLIVMTQGALGFKDSLKMVGDVAAATGQSIETISHEIGRAFAFIRDGQSLSRALMPLINLGVITPQVAKKLQDLQAAGASSVTMWREVESALGRFSGAMAETEKTAEGLIGAIGAQKDDILREFGAALLDVTKGGLQFLLEKMKELRESGAITEWAKKARDAIYTVIGAFKGLSDETTRTKTFSALKDVLIGGFEDAANGAGRILLKAAQAVGKLISQAISDFNPFSENSQWKKEVKVAKEMGIEGIGQWDWSHDDKKGIEKVRAEIARRERAAAAKEVGIGENSDGGESRFMRGINALKKLGQEAQKEREKMVHLEEGDAAKSIRPKTEQDERDKINAALAAADEKRKVEAARKAAEAEEKSRIAAEEKLHQQRIENIKKEVAARENEASAKERAISAAQTEFDRAFAMYRDPEQAAAQIAEERDYSSDYKQLQKDASRYGGKWRIDELSRLMAAGDTAGQAAKLEEWRKSSRLTPEVEAMVRAAAADKTRTTAEDELRQINANTKGLSQKLDELLKMKG